MQEAVPNQSALLATQTSPRKVLAIDSGRPISNNGNSQAGSSSAKMRGAFPPKQFDLPAGWEKMPIRTTSFDAASLDSNDPNGRFELSAAAEGISPAGDSILFVGKTNIGDGFVASLQNISSGMPSSRFGIMIRESNKPDAPFLFLGASTNSDILYVARRTFIENKEVLFSNSMQLPKRDTRMPVWLSFKKYNMNFATKYSVDGGKDWYIAFDPPSGVPFPIAESHWVGFAIFSGTVSNKADAIVKEEMENRN
jgi:hypothetical protein